LKLELFKAGALYTAALLGALMLMRCGAGITVKVDYDKQTNFATLRSFAFEDSTAPSSTERLIKEAVQSELSRKGYLLQSGDRPADFTVAYHAAVQKKTIWQREYSPGGVPTGIVPITFDEGTIAIQMLDPKTGKAIWTGRAEEAVDNQTQALEQVEPEVSKILARFPPR
jgi:hypothetical protein